MASILFLAPDDLAETVLATGALAHIVQPDDVLAISARPEAAPLFRAAPVRVRLWLPPGAALSFALFSRLRGTRPDAALLGRADWAARIAPAKRRFSLKSAPLPRHRAEAWAEALQVERALGPRLWLDDEARARAAALSEGATALLVLAPGGAARAKLWPPERFAAVARRLATGPLNGARIIAIGAGQRDREITRAIVSSLDADGLAAVDYGGEVDLLAAAALMERATLCIGNDNALTHIAAAMDAPTLTLFGPTDERVRAPYGPRVRTLRGRSLEEIASSPGLDADAAMRDVSIDAVEAAALDLLHAGGLR